MVLFHRLSTLSRVYLLSTVLSSFFFFFSSSAPFLVCEIIIIGERERAYLVVQLARFFCITHNIFGEREVQLTLI